MSTPKVSAAETDTRERREPDLAPDHQGDLHACIQHCYQSLSGQVADADVQHRMLIRQLRALETACEGRDGGPLEGPLDASLDQLRQTRGLAEELADQLEAMRDTMQRFRFRYLATHPGEAQARSAQPAAPVGRILIVDDDLLTREITADIVEQQDYQVDIAEHGEAAVEQAEKHRYDLVLMDCHLPQISGFEATTRIRARRLPHPPVIVGITSTPWHEYFEPALAAGMQEVVPKPINHVVLNRLLREYSPRVY